MIGGTLVFLMPNKELFGTENLGGGDGILIRRTSFHLTNLWLHQELLPHLISTQPSIGPD